MAAFEHNVVIEMSGENGRVLRCLHDRGGKLTSEVSQVTELTDGRLAVGSYSAPFMVLLHRNVTSSN